MTGTDKLIDCANKISPLLDDVVQRIMDMQLQPSEHIAAGFLATAELSIRLALCAPMRGDELSAEQMECIMELLHKKRREADEVLEAASLRFRTGGRAQ